MGGAVVVQHYPSQSSVPSERLKVIRLLGTGAADPTVEIGQGVTVTRTASGVYKVVFNEGPGTFVGIRGYVFGGSTPGDVKGQTLTRSTFTAPTATVDGFVSLSVWSSTFAADDLQATEYLDVTVAFSEVSGAH
jgi:hypothetical protein